MNRMSWMMVAVGFVGASSLLGLAACSSSSSGDGSSGSSGSSSGASSSGASSSGASSSGASSSGGAIKSCGSSSSSGSAGDKCTQQEKDDYASCGPTKCDAEYKAALGDGYQSGSFTGPCKSYFECFNDCNCDTSCLSKCMPSSDCTSKIQALGTCTQQKCPVPACYTSGSSSGSSGASSGSSGSSGGTCADLQACCGKITNADVKSSCTQAYDAAKGNDSTCGQYYNAFKSQCP